MSQKINIYRYMFFVGFLGSLQPCMIAMQSKLEPSVTLVGGVPIPDTFSVGKLKPILVKASTLAKINIDERNRKRSKMSSSSLEELDKKVFYAALQQDDSSSSQALIRDEELYNLFEKGANPDYVSLGYTVLHVLIKQSKFKNIVYCLNYGADLHKVDRDGSSVLHMIIQRHCRQIGETPSGKNYREYLTKLFLKKGVDPNVINKEGNTALYQAVRCNLDGVIKILLKYRANPNIGSSGTFLPLYNAWTSEQVATLIRAGAHYQNYKGMCVLIALKPWGEIELQEEKIRGGIQIALYAKEIEDFFTSVKGWPEALDNIVLGYLDPLSEPEVSASAVWPNDESGWLEWFMAPVTAVYSHGASLFS